MRAKVENTSSGDQATVRIYDEMGNEVLYLAVSAVGDVSLLAAGDNGSWEYLIQDSRLSSLKKLVNRLPNVIEQMSVPKDGEWVPEEEDDGDEEV